MKSHYFSAQPTTKSQPQTFSYAFAGQSFRFTTDAGVFSVGRMDDNSDLLVQQLPALSGSLLDLGCGFGAIGIVLAKTYGLALTQADINPRAVALAQQNASQNGVASQVVLSDQFENIADTFDTIVLNPPIHAGKTLVFALYEGAQRHLRPGGKFYVVILKKHGAESSIAHLTKIFGHCAILYKKKGRYILCGTT